ncbi:hypothetical protein [Actinotalea fermentans]|uniref:DUF2975 domain-containing protein n=1 Tax=Actinotalea fermentans TaxID=43671 RepID=A0A511YXV1_9CELL|nr:hypothetical protein [Actinotalea fermentans]KGM14802.1 hypothetical protein N867_15785 [Actinotalea fermentans ATCC 43279 = JCM 9966 = DSM 3133]GEN80030.1 hypothetical protein AFE02nite_17640 [Actinotalea fermentans]
MDERKQDRRLTLAVVAVWVCAGIMALGAVIAAAVLAKGGALWTLGGADGDLDIVQMGLLDQVTPEPGLDPVLADIPLANRLLFAVAPLVTAASWLIAAVLVTRVLRGIAAGRPFGADVVRRLPRAAVALGAGALANLGADMVATIALTASPQVNDLYSTMASEGFDFPGTTFVCAVIIGALGVAFRRGAVMERELAGLV